jgi:hypothetical protein
VAWHRRAKGPQCRRAFRPLPVGFNPPTTGFGDSHNPASFYALGPKFCVRRSANASSETSMTGSYLGTQMKVFLADFAPPSFYLYIVDRSAASMIGIDRPNLRLPSSATGINRDSPVCIIRSCSTLAAWRFPVLMLKKDFLASLSRSYWHMNHEYCVSPHTPNHFHPSDTSWSQTTSLARSCLR